MDNKLISKIKNDISKNEPTIKSRIHEKVILAALSSIPWVGSALAAMATFKTEEGSIKMSLLQRQWLEEHEKKINELRETLSYMEKRFQLLGNSIDERIVSEEYLTLVRKGFRVWDESDTTEKKQYISNLLSNAAASHKLCTDDVVRLFIDWLKIYHELHFAIIRLIHKETGITRYEIWSELRDKNLPREDSPEADLFKYIIRELSTGGVIRQIRDITIDGKFLKRRPQGRGSKSTMETAFDDTKGYILTGLGQQFVHYTLTDSVTRIERKQQ